MGRLQKVEEIFDTKEILANVSDFSWATTNNDVVGKVSGQITGLSIDAGQWQTLTSEECSKIISTFGRGFVKLTADAEIFLQLEGLETTLNEAAIAYCELWDRYETQEAAEIKKEIEKGDPDNNIPDKIYYRYVNGGSKRDTYAEAVNDRDNDYEGKLSEKEEAYKAAKEAIIGLFGGYQDTFTSAVSAVCAAVPENPSQEEIDIQSEDVGVATKPYEEPGKVSNTSVDVGDPQKVGDGTELEAANNGNPQEVGVKPDVSQYVISSEYLSKDGIDYIIKVDKDGNILEETGVDSNGNATHRNTYQYENGKLVQKYSEIGNGLVKQTFYKEDGSVDKEAELSNGKIVNGSVYGDNNDLVYTYQITNEGNEQESNYKNGKISYTLLHDAEDNVIQETRYSYDDNGNLAVEVTKDANLNGHLYQYNTEGVKTLEAYFENDQLVSVNELG
jgi:hypothetical protein